MEPVSVGLIGAGPWAEAVHAPMLASGPHTRLAGVWARRPEAAARLGAPVYERVEELFEVCEAVAFCVPPGVQAELAVQAAKAGKALLLEKPLAADLDSARRVADAVGEAAVASQMVLTFRYAPATREFLERASEIEAFGGYAVNVSGALHTIDSPWRRERGAILDVGPHMIDLLDAALGRVTGVRAHGDPLGWTGLLLEHETGAVSEASLSMAARAEDEGVSHVEVFGRRGRASLGGDSLGPDVFPAMVAEFAETVRRGGGHPLDARHGLRLQQIITAAETQLT
ncbi:gfo/Idh/MocA family oxidoreductase [Sphaerisporangium album]|uniref:Gfo/Idh/MocA family oxidoreductase n=1 Tax=Sphaerisporangium album TaxID=509200 RepID=A0A367FDB6_9ACTN|nr:Gfo/Idh/MocA family oxidoreductase [Sphaerisporangium album]RCG28373.1 gfo/Idh/MocA family oxidoreductase [Sphaerisporangium album]